MRGRSHFRLLGGLVALVFVLTVSLTPVAFASCSSSVEENEPPTTATPTSSPTATTEPTSTPTTVVEATPTSTPTPPIRTISTLVDEVEAGKVSMVVGGSSEYIAGARFNLNAGKESQEEILLVEVKFERRPNRGVHVLTLSEPLRHSHYPGESVSEIPVANPEPTSTPYPHQIPRTNPPSGRTPSVPQIPADAKFVFDPVTAQVDKDALKLGVERASQFYAEVLGQSGGPITFVTVSSGCKGVVATYIAQDTICVNVQHPDWVNRTFEQKFKTGAHEYFHNVQRSVGCQVGWDSGGLDPVWLGEGSAEFYAFWVLSESGMTPLYQTIEQLKLPLRVDKSLTLPAMEVPAIQSFSYSLAAVAVDFLVSKSDIDSYIAYCGLRSSGVQWMSAFEQAFGISPSEFYEQFELYRTNGYR